MRLSFLLTLKSRIVRGLLVLIIAAPMLFPATVSAVPVDVCPPPPKNTQCENFMKNYVAPIFNGLALLIAVAAVISYITVAIQYSAAGDDSGAVSKAKNRAFKTTVGIISYFLFYAFLNYIVPGGIL